jgi:hypothetical protein
MPTHAPPAPVIEVVVVLPPVPVFVLVDVVVIPPVPALPEEHAVSVRKPTITRAG